MEFVKEPWLDKVRTEIGELQRLMAGAPTDQSVTLAWAAMDKITKALAELCPNHPQVYPHLR